MATHAHKGHGHLLADPTTGTTTDSTAKTMLPMYCRITVPLSLPAVRVPVPGGTVGQFSGRLAEQQRARKEHVCCPEHIEGT
jgi:hypothetical protein